MLIPFTTLYRLMQRKYTLLDNKLCMETAWNIIYKGYSGLCFYLFLLCFIIFMIKGWIWVNLHNFNIRCRYFEYVLVGCFCQKWILQKKKISNQDLSPFQLWIYCFNTFYWETDKEWKQEQNYEFKHFLKKSQAKTAEMFLFLCW